MMNVMGEILPLPFKVEHPQNGVKELLDLIKDYRKDQVRFMKLQGFIM